MKTITYEEFNALKNTPHTDKRDVEEAFEVSKIVNKFWPCKLTIQMLEDIPETPDGVQYVDGILTTLEHKYLTLNIIYRSGRKVWFIANRTKYPATSHHDALKLSKPNNIGVLTTKKIQQWVSFYEMNHQHLRDLGFSRQKRVAFIEEQLAKLKVDGAEIIDHGQVKYAIKNNLEYKVVINEGQIASERIDYVGQDSIEDFVNATKFRYEKSN